MGSSGTGSHEFDGGSSLPHVTSRCTRGTRKGCTTRTYSGALPPARRPPARRPEPRRLPRRASTTRAGPRPARRRPSPRPASRPASSANRARPGNAPPRVLAGYRRTAADRGRGQARPFGAADLATVLVTCHRPHRRGRGRGVESNQVALERGAAADWFSIVADLARRGRLCCCWPASDRRQAS